MDRYEDIDYKLTDEETDKIIPTLVKNFKEKIGEDNAVTNSHIVRVLKQHGIKTSGPRVRYMVHYIRMNDLVPCLIASSKGYYVALTMMDVHLYDESLKSRVDAMQRIRHSLIRQRKIVFKK